MNGDIIISINEKDVQARSLVEIVQIIQTAFDERKSEETNPKPVCIRFLRPNTGVATTAATAAADDRNIKSKSESTSSEASASHSLCDQKKLLSVSTASAFKRDYNSYDEDDQAQQKGEHRGNIGDEEEEVEGDDYENDNNYDDDALTVTARQEEEESEEDNRSSTDDTSADDGFGNNDVDISVDHNSDNNEEDGDKDEERIVYFLKAKQEARDYLLAKYGRVNEEEEIALV
jgi:hypothetical protein